MAFRDLLWVLTLRDLRARYRGHGLGYFWSILNPLLLLVVYTVVFSTILRVGIDDFVLFLACGLLPWTWFSTALSVATGSVRQGAGFVRRIYFPAQVLPLVAVLSQLVHFLVSLPLVLLLAAVLGRVPGAPLMALVPIVLIQTVFTSGLALFVSSLGVRFRDLEHILSNVLLVLFFLAPIIYAPEMVPTGLRWVLRVNPLAVLIGGYQDVLYRRAWPDWMSLGLALTVSVLVFGAGALLFERERRGFAELL
ncbi:MAG: ABC transporter permease [Gemmatimonadetes bacterium]|nr:ABC transporter permease [Gemmatimonadota bacterium]